MSHNWQLPKNEEDALLDAVFRWDNEATKLFLQRYGGAIKAAIRRRWSIISSRDDHFLHDVLTDSYLRLMRSRHMWRKDTRLGPYFYTIARHTAIDLLKREYGNLDENTKLVLAQEMKSCVATLDDDNNEATEQDREMVCCFINTLSKIDRDVFLIDPDRVADWAATLSKTYRRSPKYLRGRRIRVIEKAKKFFRDNGDNRKRAS
jgi:DNA-directed RNA polymerase specialized sigma24 family protein